MKADSEKLYLLIRRFLEVHLPRRRGASVNTIRSYRTALAQFVDYMVDEAGVPATSLSLDDFTEEAISCFLDEVEKRGCSVSTRNQRLAALRSFLAFAAQEDVACMAVLARSHRVPKKKTVNKPVGYLTEGQLTALLEQPDPKSERGLRDLTILSMLYDTAARATELLNVSLGDLHLTLRCPYVVLFGKGSKVRSVPLMVRTISLLETYIATAHPYPSAEDPLFFTVAHGKRNRMSYECVAKMVAKYGRAAAESHPGFPERCHAHLLRHTRAMHLYQDGVPLSYVKEVLGHANINTTGIYASADLEMLRKVMEPLDMDLPTASPMPRWENEKERLMKLAGLM